MRIRNRSFIIMVSKALAQASSIALGICLVRMIDPVTFGTYRQLILIFTTVSTLLSLQLEDSLFYFVPKLPPERLRPLVAQTVLLGLAASSVSSAIMFFGADYIAELFENPAIAAPLRIFAFYPLTEKILVLVPAFMLSTDKALRAAGYSLAASVGRVVAALIAFALGADLLTVVLAMVCISAVLMIVAVGNMILATPKAPIKFDAALAKEQFGYCIPLLLTALVGVLNVQFDKLLISIYFKDPAIYGIYSCGAMELPVISIITNSVSAAIMPNLVTLVHQDKFREAIAIWQEAARKCSMIIIPTFAFLIATPVDFIKLLYGPGYGQAAWPFSVYLLLLPMRVALYAALLRAAGRTAPIASIAGKCLLLNLALGTTLVFAGRGSWLSFIGPSVGSAISMATIMILLLREVCRVTHMPAAQIMRWDELGRILLYALASAVIMLLIPMPHPAGWRLESTLTVHFAIRGVLFAGMMIGLMWGLRFLTADEKRLILTPVRWVSRRSKRPTGIGG